MGTVTRLRGRKDFERVFEQGRSLPGRLVVLRCVRTGQSASRLGIAVGRQLGNAVLRNRVRRRWRAVVRLGPTLQPGWDLVLVARRPSIGAPWGELAAAWADVVRRAGLLLEG